MSCETTQSSDQASPGSYLIRSNADPYQDWSIIPLDTNEPYLVGAYPYLKIAVDWAQSLNLKVGQAQWWQIARL